LPHCPPCHALRISGHLAAEVLKGAQSAAPGAPGRARPRAAGRRRAGGAELAARGGRAAVILPASWRVRRIPGHQHPRARRGGRPPRLEHDHRPLQVGGGHAAPVARSCGWPARRRPRPGRPSWAGDVAGATRAWGGGGQQDEREGRCWRPRPWVRFWVGTRRHGRGARRMVWRRVRWRPEPRARAAGARRQRPVLRRPCRRVARAAAPGSYCRGLRAWCTLSCRLYLCT